MSAQMASPMHTVHVELDSAAHLGTGRPAGFRSGSHPYVPAPTWRGAVSAAWWLRREGEPPAEREASQRKFDALIGGLSFGDAVPTTSIEQPLPQAVALDQRQCKYPKPECPDQYGWWVLDCESCNGPTEAAKGTRTLPQGSEMRSLTRTELTATEQATDDKLFQREMLSAPGVPLIALLAGDPADLVTEGLVLRLGAKRSVMGRARILAVRQLDLASVELSGTTCLRLELLSPGCYVDGLGRASRVPSGDDVRSALGLSPAAQVSVVRSFTRWGTAGGWHAAANRPKPVDVTVIAHSVHFITVDVPAPTAVPGVVPDLGLRTTEGCGWARVDLCTDVQEPTRAY